MPSRSPMISKPLHAQASAAIRNLRLAIITALPEPFIVDRPQEAVTYRRISEADVVAAAHHRLDFLAQALSLNSQAVFIDYTGWAKVAFKQRNITTADLVQNLEDLAEVLRMKLPEDLGSLSVRFVDAAVQALPTLPDELPSFIHPGAPLSPLPHQYFEALRRGEREIASRLVLDAVATGTSVRDIYLHVFQAAQYEIGRLWQINRATVAQEHYCTAATQLIMSQLYPHIFASRKNGRTLVATSVSGDLHEIGVRMVADFFEMEGWSTFYLGANTPHGSVVDMVREQQADVLAVSATISYHVDAVRDLIEAVRNEPGCDGVKILVGGYPFNLNPELWRQLGADGSASDALGAITLANQFTTHEKHDSDR